MLEVASLLAMSYRESVYTSAACAPLSQFSQAVKYNGMMYCSGVIGIDPKTDHLVPGTATDRARMALQNLKAVLEAAGSSLDRVVKANIFLADMKDFDAVNVAWDEAFPEDPKPVSNFHDTTQGALNLMIEIKCRTCVAVNQLPLGTDVEIEMIASYD